MTSLAKILDSFWKWRMRRTPEFASLAGNTEFDSCLETWTEDRFKEDLQTCLSYKKQLDDLAIDDPSQLINAKLFREELDTFIDGAPFKGYLFPVNFMEGPQADFQRLGSEWMTLKTDQDYRNLIGRYEAFPTFAENIVQTLQKAVDLKLTNHARSMKNVIETYQKFQDTPTADSAFMEPFQSLDSAELRDEAAVAINTKVLPGLKTIQDFLEKSYMANLRPDIAATSLPNGTAYYSQCLKYHTSTDMTAQEIHDLGVSEVARIRADMTKIVTNELGQPADLKSFIEKLRNDKSFYYQTPEQLMERFRSLIEEEINPNLHKLFWNPPDLPLDITEMPPALTGGPAAYYIAGTSDGTRPGKFFVNLKRYDSQPKYECISLALHEGNPGHHLQASYSQLAGFPMFRTVCEDRCYSMSPSRFPINTAFVEGWALYCENLGHDLNLYNDPYDRFGHLSEEVFRASRLVVDTGMHALGWSRDRAVAFMADNTAASQQNIQAEIDRYITWPGQATGYKIGEIKLSQLRSKAEKELGQAFDIRDFHEVILKSAGPLSIVEQEVKDYINNKKSSET